MSELRDLYQEVILDHYHKPRNFGSLDDEARKVEGYNPLCGDQVSLFVEVKDGRVVDVAFEGVGCAISTASASMMTEAVKGKSVEEVSALLEKVHTLFTGPSPDAASEEPSPSGDSEMLEGELGKLEALSGVREYPVRIKCATLAWHALKAALEEDQDSVTTE